MYLGNSKRIDQFLSIFKDQSKAYKIILRITSEFGLLSEFENSLNVIDMQLKNCANADLALSHFYDFVEHLMSKSMIFELIRAYKSAGNILFGIFSQSNTLSATLIKNPEYFSLLIENEILNITKDLSRYNREIENLLRHAKDFKHKKYLLRRYKKKEYLRIGTREIIQVANFIVIMNELSNLAKALVAASIDIAYDELKKIIPDADKNICIIALGKLGTDELNFSSDIDIIFVHETDEKIAYYHKLAVKTVSILNEKNREGFLYRVDLRLRPGGKNAPISMSVDGYRNYYATFGQLWERMALLKAQPIAGNIALGKQLLREIVPFVYKKSIDSSYIEEIRSLLFKIKKYVRTAGSESLDKEKVDVKKGTGGIREIEFIINYFQLIHGSDEELRNISMIDALQVLKSKEYMPVGADFLRNAYLFLRRIEHKIQILNEMQTQRLPETDEKLMYLAKSMHLSLHDFIQKYNQVTDKVHKRFTAIFIESSDIPVFGFAEDLEGVLKEKGIKGALSAANLITETARKWAVAGFDKSRISEVLNYAFKFIPNEILLMEAIKGFNALDPSYILTIYDNRLVFNILLKLFSIGYANMIGKDRGLMEEFFLINEPIKIAEITKNEKRRLEFAITLKILSGNFDISLFKILTEFADRFIVKTISDYSKNEIAVIGYGKLGIGELSIKSDLDLLFISQDIKRPTSDIQTVVRELKKLYDVDLRLKPFGNDSPVVINLKYLDNYFSKSAHTWEHLSAQKARIIYSDFSTKDIIGLYKKQLKTKISGRAVLDMKLKIEKSKHDTFDIKHFAGGLMDIEFVTQYLCIKNGYAESGLSVLTLLEKIRNKGILELEQITTLRNSYLFYSKIISVIKIIEQYGRANYKIYDMLGFILEDLHSQENIEHYRAMVISISNEVFQPNA